MTFLLSRSLVAALLIPVLLLFLLFFLYPLGVVLWKSFHSEAGYSLAAYRALFSTPLFMRVLQTTFVIACTGTVASTVLGYCVAAHIAKQPAHRQPVFLAFVMLPLWTSVLVKAFALAFILGEHGLINRMFVAFFGEGAVVQLLFNRTGVILGMVNYLLPFTVFPILASLLAIDPQLGRAASLMGATRWRIFSRITLPLTLPGVLAAVLMALTLSMGMFVTPALLGGRQDIMMANLVDLYTRQILDWQGASAVALLLLVISLLFITLLLKVRKNEFQAEG